MKMTKSYWLGAIALGVLTWTGACAKEMPTAPSANPAGSSEEPATSPGATIGTMAVSPIVTLQPDLTATPASVSVPVYSKVLFVNNSGSDVTVRSYNCTEFSLLRIPAGYSLRTQYFTPAGKTCDYFAWDVNWSRKIFVGQVVVQ